MKMSPRIIYTRQKCMAKYRGIDFHLSFDEWNDIWQASGKWNERGRGKGKYCMSRVNDTGAYAVGNVFIQLTTQNSGDLHRGTTQDPTIIAKRVQKITGKPQSIEHKLAISMGQKKRYAEMGR